MWRFVWRKEEFYGVISMLSVETSWVVFRSVVISAKVVCCVVYRRRWRTKRRYLVELVLPENFVPSALREQEGILYVHACVRCTTIAWAYQIWWREIETLVLSYSPLESHFVSALIFFTFLQKIFCMTKIGRFLRRFSVVEFLQYIGFVDFLKTS